MTWIETSTGGRFDYLSPEFNIDDIAAALSKTCRFGGQCSQFYSVAEHSILVHDLLVEDFEDTAAVDPNVRLAALLHDAPEAYLGDVPTPLKSLLPDYRKLEKAITRDLLRSFGIDMETVPGSVRDALKLYDSVAFYIEAAALMPSKGSYPEWLEGGAPVGHARAKALAEHYRNASPRMRYRLLGASPQAAERRFLTRYHEIRESS